MRRLAAAVSVAVSAALLPAVPAMAALDPKWVAGPDLIPPLGATGAQWNDVAATGPADVWAVGTWRNPGTNALVGHWNGAAWTPSATPLPTAPTRYDLAGVDAVSPTDVWAVGTATASTQNALLMHYDGRWTATTGPVQPIGVNSALTDIDMLSPGDGWAVGHVSSGTKPPQALILHWQGGAWTSVATGTKDNASADLTAVHARAADDVWAVGTRLRLDGKQASLILHWNGVDWREVPTPDTGAATDEETLTSVAALTADDAWAVGTVCPADAGEENCHPLALRLIAGAWTRVPTAGSGTELTGVVPLSADDVWIIGYLTDQALTDTDYAEHWDGRVFTVDGTLPKPPGGATTNGELASALEAATAVPGTGGVWAVGWARHPDRGTPHSIHRG